MEKRRFVQDRFAIGFWVDPPADQAMAQHYQRIADANFTLVLGGFGATTPETVARQLTLCEKHGLRALVSLPGYRAGAHAGKKAKQSVEAQDGFPDSPACWGYMLRDEPNASMFADLRYMVDHLRKARPGKLAYINLYPNYANAKQLGTPSYAEHVARFAQDVDPDVLCMDHYPLMRPDVDNREAYCQNLAVLREHAVARDVPFWNFFHTMPFGNHTDPTEAQIRWQIYTSLAYGAKGVLYFCYWTPAGAEFPRGSAIIRRDGRPTRHYDQATRINADLRALGRTLMRLTSTRVVRIRPGDDSAALLAGTSLKSLSAGNYLIGLFRHEDGRRAVLINNYEHAYTAWPDVAFDAAEGAAMEVSKRDGREAPVIDDSPAMPGLQVSLDAGEGRLFLVP